ncbi:MAG: TspO/MBR family protein [Labrys sp. (in: a-proteobacteria)]|jgi:benzodiazapine receptor
MDLSLLAFIGVSAAAAMSGALFKPGEWYDGLAKPWWNPPKFVFPLVWSILYAMIAVSGWMAWHAATPEQLPLAMAVFGAQLALNALWSAIFFGMKRMRLAMIEVVFLWASIAINIAVFWSADPRAALLLVPYLIWVSIASYLNWTMIRLNPNADAAGSMARSA